MTYIKKSLKDISWVCKEKEYRADPAISYSNISFYFREGFRNLPKMKDKIDSEAIRYGSLVDCILTEPERLDEEFYISAYKRPSEAICRMTEDLYGQFKDRYDRLGDVPKESLIEALDKESYYVNYGPAKRMEYLLKGGIPYYKLLLESGNKTIVSDIEYYSAKRTASTLESNNFTSEYFVPNPFKRGIEHLYQLKFKSSFEGIDLKCMFDLVIVDHVNKKIRPCDLKTTGYNEDEFEDSFVKWCYWIQATLYTYILKQVISSDEYFKDFEIGYYEFIVINRFNDSPMVWIFEHNFHEGDFKSSNGLILRGWRSLLLELAYHLENQQFKYLMKVVEGDGTLKIKKVTPCIS